MIDGFKRLLQDQRGISQLVVIAIVAAAAGTIAYGIYAGWAPKLKELNERGQSVLG